MKRAGSGSIAALLAAGLALFVADAGAGPDVVSPDMETRTVSGFRMEGAPEIEVVFGDAERYEAHVDRFYELEASMSERRSEFNRAVQTSVATLAAHRRGPCPTDALAPLYYRAHTALERYASLGADFEGEYLAIVQLDELGETAALTPDYRWKINRVRGLYRDALTDYREMRAAIGEQVGSELRHRRCKTSELLTLGAETVPDAAGALVGPPPTGIIRKLRRKDVPSVPASPATFFIDNRDCDGPMEIYVDGALLGEVASGAEAAFQSLAGHHSMCLIPEGQGTACGDTGTMRSAYIYDGWSMTMYCQ